MSAPQINFAQLNLDPSISKAIMACGYETPTPVQQRSIPEILNGHDIVASAQTGTGKTAAFVLPALHRLSLKQDALKPRILILTPTRELASQITQSAAKYGKFLRFRMASLVGGMSYRQQLKDLSGRVDLIVATPGRLLDHMENRRLDLSGIEMLVLDEADRMLDMGFIDDVQAIARATPTTRQTLLFSATVDDKLGRVVKHLLKNPVRIDLSPEKMSPSLIKQELYMADHVQHKNRLLMHFLENQNIFKAIIFTATKIGADKLAAQLCDKGMLAAPLHGDLKQNQRNKTVEQLRRGKIQYVVATDVAARGIDIADMTHVFNYDLPKFSEDYVHRIGRTGRAGKTGIAISFAVPADVRHIVRIERFIGQKVPSLVIEGLEPSKKTQQSATASAQPSSKRSFGKEGRFSRSNGDGKPGKRFGGKPSFGRSGDRFADKADGDSRRGRPGDKFAGKPARSGDRFADKAEDGGARRGRSTDKFAGKPSAGRSEGRFAPRSEEGGARRGAGRSNGFAGKPSGERSGSRFSDKPSGERSASRFADKSSGERSGSRFADKSGGERSGSRFADKSGGERSGSRFADKPSTGRSGDRFAGKPSTGRSGDRFADKSESGERRGGRSSDKFGGGKPSTGRSGFAPRSEEGAARRGRSTDKPVGGRSSARSDDGAPRRARPAERTGKPSSGPFRGGVKRGGQDKPRARSDKA